MDTKKEEKLIIKNFRLAYDAKKDRPMVIKLNRLAIATERPPADIYRMALDKGVLMVAAQHGIDPTILQLADAG